MALWTPARPELVTGAGQRLVRGHQSCAVRHGHCSSPSSEVAFDWFMEVGESDGITES
jgi:hypothetical protein